MTLQQQNLIALNDRVRIKNTMQFNERIGTVIPTSDHPEDFWDWYVLLDSDADGFSNSQVIGVTLDRIVVISGD